MRVLVLGAGGMLGHQLFQTLNSSGVSALGTVRKSVSHYHNLGLSFLSQLISNFDVSDTSNLISQLNELEPDVIVNCVGMTPRKFSNIHDDQIIDLNATFPQRLKNWCVQNDKRLIHISTDCVFSGKTGPYTEESPRDALDVYGLSKALGEVMGSKILTLRTSIVGIELEGKTELLEWFLSQKGRAINGFSKVIYSGVTTNFLAKTILKVIQQQKSLEGLFQVASTPISKFALLEKANVIFKNNCQISNETQVSSDKTLIGKKFMTQTGIVTPSWDEMLTEIAISPSFKKRAKVVQKPQQRSAS